MTAGGVLRRLALSAATCALASCTTGEGTGWVKSDLVYIEDCWNGPLDLAPDFFGANPFREETLLIRMQKGDNIEEVSDGVLLLVNDVGTIRGDGVSGLLGQDIAVGLPPGVIPAGGVPRPPGEGPVYASLVLYLHDTCHVQNSALSSLRGTIRFSHLFSGDRNEPMADARLTEASFNAEFGDPRTPDAPTSQVAGYVRFFFQRGQPAQPFP